MGTSQKLALFPQAEPSQILTETNQKGMSLIGCTQCGHPALGAELISGNQIVLTRKTLADQLGVSLRYVDKLMKEEGLPYYKIGKCVRFIWGEVAKWLSERRQS